MHNLSAYPSGFSAGIIANLHQGLEVAALDQHARECARTVEGFRSTEMSQDSFFRIFGIAGVGLDGYGFICSRMWVIMYWTSELSLF
jgi:hypothetical protein